LIDWSLPDFLSIMSITQNKPDKPGFKARSGQKPLKAKKITRDYLHNAGLFYLQRFAASTARFRSVMTRKIDRSCRAHEQQDRAACLEMLENVIENFTRAGLLDDVAYANASAASLQRRGLSLRAIRAKLAAKGIDSALAERAMEDLQGDDLSAALRLARKKRLGPFAGDAPGKILTPDKALATLARAGFSFDTAKTVLHMSREDAERALEGM
jgi:regulatory protein